jgi:release factor glutamine methyltransferase
MNIQSTLKNASKILNSFNIKTPLLDSEVLLARAINKDRQYIILNLNKKLNQNCLNKFNYLIKRRTKGEPIAYLLKKKDFWKETFYVNKNVLIPRPDTELIVEQVLKLFPSKSNLQILDIGTGSGCILLSILKERSNFYGTGIDISKKSINVCKYNTKILNIKNRVKFYNSNVDNFIIGKYDLITSNPAYIKTLSLKYLEKDIYRFEPREALNGGVDGFSQIRKVVDKAAFLIKKNGKFILEIGFNQKNKVCEMLKNRKFYINKALKDYGNNYRCIISTKL